MKNIIAIAALGMTVLSSIEAAGTSGAQFLKMGAGAKATSMGNAQVAVADDVTAGYWNPAGLSQIENTQVAVMHNEGLVDTQYEYAGAAMRVRNSAIGFNLYSMNYGSIDGYTSANVRNGSFDARSLAGAFTFSSSFNDKVRWGANAKYITESIEAESASGMALDLGLLYTADTYKLGATIQNMGSKMKFVQEESKLPTLVSVGASRKLLSDKLQVAIDLSKYNDAGAALHGGLDYNVNSVLALRGGYDATSTDVDGLTGVAAGVGIKLGAVALDYAFRPFGDLGDTHRISLLIQFNRLNTNY